METYQAAETAPKIYFPLQSTSALQSWHPCSLSRGAWLCHPEVLLFQSVSSPTSPPSTSSRQPQGWLRKRQVREIIWSWPSRTYILANPSTYTMHFQKWNPGTGRQLYDSNSVWCMLKALCKNCDRGRLERWANNCSECPFQKIDIKTLHLP